MLAPNGKSLLSVFEFEKQKSMILTDDEIRIAAQSWVGLTDAPNPNATSFAAGAKFVLQKLQQCNVLRSVCPKENTHKWFGAQGYNYCDECGEYVGQTDA